MGLDGLFGDDDQALGQVAYRPRDRVRLGDAEPFQHAAVSLAEGKLTQNTEAFLANCYLDRAHLSRHRPALEA